jgi:peroxin-1
MILSERGCFEFEPKLVDFLVDHADGFVFKDFEKLIEQLIFNSWSPPPTPTTNQQQLTNTHITLKASENTLYTYTCINMLETKFYKSKHELSWSQIGGLDEAKATLIENLVWPIKYKHLYARLQMKQSGGCLLYGPSGCGKTLIASALANESKFNFMSVKGPELLSKYIGAEINK